MFGIFAALVVINILSYYRVKLYLSVLAGIVLVALFNRFALTEVYTLFWGSVTSSVSVSLALIIITLTGFGSLYKETGNLRTMVDKLALILRDRRHQVVVLPAIVGLMAFPGGAVFSAPLVEEAGAGLEISGTKLAVGNIMFRHMYYLIFPFYPGLIFLVEVSKIGMMPFIKFNLPILAAFFVFIYLYMFRKVKLPIRKKADFSQLPHLLHSMIPLLVIFILALGFKVNFPLSIVAGIIAAMLNYLPKDVPLQDTLKKRASVLYSGVNWSMALSIMSILVLKDFMEHSGAISTIVDILVANGVPLILLAIILPFLTGVITGNQTAALGLSVPVFLTAASGSSLLYILGLVYVTSLAGYLGSPLHLCTILTAEHFKAPLQQVMKTVNLLSLFLVALGVVTYLISVNFF